MLDDLKNLARGSKRLTIAYRICDNWRERMRFSMGKFAHSNGSVIRRHSTPQTTATYIRRTFEDYVNYAGLTSERLQNLRILEIGHGDNYGVALLFLAYGAKHVTCLDKYYSIRDPRQEHAVYTLLQKDLDGAVRSRFDQAIDLNEGIHPDPEKLTPVYGVRLEEAAKHFPPASFDLIISRAVVQYLVFDLAFSAMDQLLAKEGYMIHRIDLRDIGVFPRGRLHPLTFLTIPDRTYRWMTSDSPQPNRKRVSDYRKKMKELHYSAKILVTRVLGREDELVPHRHKLHFGRDYSHRNLELLEAIRPKLLPRFRDLPDEDLLETGIFLMASKDSSSYFLT